MASLGITIKTESNLARKIVVELDADKLEKLAAGFGFFNPDFLESIDRAEKDYKYGRVRKVKSLKELRQKSTK